MQHYSGLFLSSDIIANQDHTKYNTISVVVKDSIPGIAKTKIHIDKTMVKVVTLVESYDDEFSRVVVVSTPIVIYLIILLGFPIKYLSLQRNLKMPVVKLI